MRTGIKVSIKQALQSDIWDVVTLQQASSLSVDYNTYQPYLNALADYVHIHAPKAKNYDTSKLGHMSKTAKDLMKK